MKKTKLNDFPTTVEGTKVILEKLRLENSDDYFELYKNRIEHQIFEESVFLFHENHEEFTQRILSLCHIVYVIKLKEKPNILIGDCALHQCNKEQSKIFIGGTIHSDYKGRGYMKETFSLVINLLKQNHFQTLMSETSVYNTSAIHFINKMGFKLKKDSDAKLLYEKNLS
ncbi:GNAT family N-acetyltransferase [Flavobacterium sp. NRK F10]|uniref:GNAT family N-acetyltransferase n=1 Tax=Flavobacterium sp. NRK F10 TaxID=2954931 RepID=UPI00209064D8|nr:GNAT family protein [Flavobacterium sp. NRK F10]MCO6173425.1 GNAT family N-acetyltransferase [Flavobacterium sp. NRK F10]